MTRAWRKLWRGAGCRGVLEGCHPRGQTMSHGGRERKADVCVGAWAPGPGPEPPSVYRVSGQRSEAQRGASF